MEMEEVPTTAPSRQHTLESQRETHPLPSILRRILGKDRANSQLSGPVDDVIEAAARRYSHNGRDARRFLNDFGHMSRRPNARLHEIFDVFIRLPRTTAGSSETIGAC